MLGFDDLFGLALLVATGVVVVGGVETLDKELETRRGTVAVLEPGAMVLSLLVKCHRSTCFVEACEVFSYLCLLKCDARRFGRIDRLGGVVGSFVGRKLPWPCDR